MTITAVIAEYNPFHNGHAYQLAKARELTGADYLVVIMSGDFVQRGAPAILDQHDRAELALLGGADLILQLPCHFALGSAQHFARGAVSLLTALGCVDFLCFGSEYGDTAPFLELADVLLHEPEEYRELLSGLLRNGLSFPTARAQALSAYFSDSASFSSLSKEELDTFLKEPNNILGIEYVQALLLSQSRIRPVTIRREGSGYHEGALFTQALPSATAMRNLLFPIRIRVRNCPRSPPACRKQSIPLSRTPSPHTACFPAMISACSSPRGSSQKRRNPFPLILIFRRILPTASSASATHAPHFQNSPCSLKQRK